MAMTKTDYEVIASALRTCFPNMGMRVKVFRHLAPVLGERNSEFKPERFGASMGIPRLFCTQTIDEMGEVTRNAKV